VRRHGLRSVREAVYNFAHCRNPSGDGERGGMKALAGMKTKELTVTFTEEYFEQFKKHCDKQGLTPDQMIGQLIAVDMSPPNVIWGPWKPAA